MINIQNGHNVKAIAFHLPQFHTIPENDEWWGEGFTEWTNVKKAKPLFKNHNQPRVPHDDVGYYDLSNIDILRKQGQMAKKYGIYGFCFYHYYFKNGKRLLEKPVDMLLENPDIDLPFCLCWANEAWSRRWDGDGDYILAQQDHSPENLHRFIENLAKYIKDERYIRINGKPLILIYRTDLFENINQALSDWRKYCLENNIGEVLFAKIATRGDFG